MKTKAHKGEWLCTYFRLSVNQHNYSIKKIEVRKFTCSIHETLSKALSFSYRSFEFSHVCWNKKLQRAILSNLWFGPYIEFCIVTPASKIEPRTNTSSFHLGFDTSDKFFVGRLKSICEEIIKETRKSKSTRFKDLSIQLSQNSISHTLPKGYYILPPGAVIRETDLMFYSWKPFYWRDGDMFKHEDAGKVVKQGPGTLWRMKPPKKDVYLKGPPEPLAARKFGEKRPQTTKETTLTS